MTSNFIILGGGVTLEVTVTCFNFSMLGGGVHQPEPKCHIDLRFQLFHSCGRRVHQPEPKCHIDLRFQLFHSWGVHLQVDRKSVRFTDSGWLSTAATNRELY